MDNKKWFIDFCNMSEDERYLYEEFEMDKLQKILIMDYKRLYESVSIMAMDYERQVLSVPSNLNIADEIALMFQDEVVEISDRLLHENMLTTRQYDLINAIKQKLSDMNKHKEVNFWTSDALKKADNWDFCRETAKQLLSQLYY